MTRYIASSYTNRGGCVKRRCLERCPHRHRTLVGARRCAARMNRLEKKPRWWVVDTVVWLATAR